MRRTALPWNAALRRHSSDTAWSGAGRRSPSCAKEGGRQPPITDISEVVSRPSGRESGRLFHHPLVMESTVCTASMVLRDIASKRVVSVPAQRSPYCGQNNCRGHRWHAGRCRHSSRRSSLHFRLWRLRSPSGSTGAAPMSCRFVLEIIIARWRAVLQLMVDACDEDARPCRHPRRSGSCRDEYPRQLPLRRSPACFLPGASVCSL